MYDESHASFRLHGRRRKCGCGSRRSERTRSRGLKRGRCAPKMNIFKRFWNWLRRKPKPRWVKRKISLEYYTHLDHEGVAEITGVRFVPKNEDKPSYYIDEVTLNL